MRTRTFRVVVIVLAAATLTGCMTKPPSRVHYVGPDAGPAFASTTRGGVLRLSSLGAGHPLGRSVHQNDRYLAYMTQVSAPIRLGAAPDVP